MAGAYVFPGGTVEAGDRAIDNGLVDDPSAPHLPLRVAAIREAFEEAGVLLAAGVDAARLATDEARTARRRLHDRTDAFDWTEWLAAEGLVLGVGSLGLWSRWVTPEAEPRRYDTWFFRAIAPDGQEPDHDDVEMSDSLWARPVDALAAADHGDVVLVPPTRKNLEALIGVETAEEALAATVDGGSADPILPAIERRRDGTTWVTHQSFEPVRLR